MNTRRTQFIRSLIRIAVAGLFLPMVFSTAQAQPRTFPVKLAWDYDAAALRWIARFEVYRLEGERKERVAEWVVPGKVPMDAEPLVVELSVGTHTLYVVAVDVDGPASPPSDPLALVVEVPPPPKAHGLRRVP